MNINNLKTEFHALEDHFSSAISLKKLSIGKNSIAYYARIDLPHFNVLLQRENTQELELFINEAKQFFNQNGVHEWVWVVRNDLDSDALQNVLKLHNFIFEESGSSTALCYSFGQNSEMIHEISLDIRPIEHNNTEWLDVMQAGFGGTDITNDQYCQALGRAKSKGMQHFLGYVQNIPVATMTLTFLNRGVRIDNVATHPSYQRLGYATQMVQFGLNLAKQMSIENCFLDASSKGLGLYKRIGFFELFTYQIYSCEKISNTVG